MPSATAGSGFVITCSGVDAGRTALLFCGRNMSALPWKPGNLSTMCMWPGQGRILRCGTFDTGGQAGTCNGSFSLDFNTFMRDHPGLVGPDPWSWQWSVGRFELQAWYRDPQAVTHGMLSTALSFETCNSNAPVCTPLVPSLIAIQPGSFVMGSDVALGYPYFPEHGYSGAPAHPVTITYPYWIGETEVTAEEYASIMGTRGSAGGLPGHPVVAVGWQEARAYCSGLNVQMEAQGLVPPSYEYRLPTEAEWEYAARAGTTTEYCTGTTLDCGEANIYKSLHSGVECVGYELWHSNPVRQYPPNAWGLYGILDNAAEWCLDTAAPYTAAAAVDPFVTGPGLRVHRGGAFAMPSSISRSAARIAWPEWFMTYNGLRVVLAPKRQP
jgi:formylglycine-generating enzyme required for sulfatase activity